MRLESSWIQFFITLMLLQLKHLSKLIYTESISICFLSLKNHKQE